MATIYRATAKSNRYGTRDQIAPGFVREVRRDSKKARNEAIAAYADLLARVMPDDGGQAWLEISDRFGLRVLARHVGKATKRDPISGRVLDGEWVAADVWQP